MGWQNLLSAIDGAGVSLAGARVCQHMLSLSCPQCDFFALESLDTILPWLQAVSWSHCLEHNTYTNILWDNSKVELLRSQGSAALWGSKQLLTQPWILSAEKSKPSSSSGLQMGREGREEELATGPRESQALLGHSSHPSCQEAIHIPS